MAHDVFISYSSEDKAIADAVCHSLEGRRIRCWIAPRDVLPGTSFEKSIINAIHDCRVFILIFSSKSNSSSHVENEVKLAWNKGIPIIPFRIEDVQFSDLMTYYISSQHWLDALTTPMEQHLNKLGDTVEVFIKDNKPAPEPAAQPPKAEAPAAPKQKQKIPVLPIALVVVALVVIGGIVLAMSSGFFTANNNSPSVSPTLVPSNVPVSTPGAISSPVPVASGGDAMFRGNPQLTGVYNAKGPSGAASLKWSFRTNGSIESSPAVYNGTVFVGSDDGSVYAVDELTGALKWATAIQDKQWTQGDSIYSSPALFDGIVYVYTHYGGTLHALDTMTGQEKWNYGTGDELASSPVISDGVLYLISSSGLYAFDAKTGAGKWTCKVTSSISAPGISPSVAVGNGFAVVNNYDHVVAVDTTTGTEKWRYKSEYGFDGSPAISNGVVYINGDSTKLYAFNLQTGDLLWKSELNGMALYASPGVADGMVFDPMVSGNMVALDVATGKEKWTFKTGDFDQFRSSPAIAGGIIYIGCDNGYVYALDEKTGMAQWKYKTKDKVSSSPAVADGMVFVGSEDHYLYALG